MLKVLNMMKLICIVFVFGWTIQCNDKSKPNPTEYSGTLDTEDEEDPLANEEPIEVTPIEPDPLLLTVDVVKDCLFKDGTEGLIACIEAKGIQVPEGLTLEEINACNEAGSLNSIPICLQRKGFILGYVLSKSDVDECLVELSDDTTQLAACLHGKGDDAGWDLEKITQEAVDACLTKVSAADIVWKCFKRDGLLPGYIPSQEEINDCIAIDQSYAFRRDTSNIATCLDGKGWLPVGITQVEIDACIEEMIDGEQGLYNCFKRHGYAGLKGYIPSRLDVRECRDEFGNLNNLYTCFTSKEGNADWALEGFTQADIDTCIAAGSTTNTQLINCLRAAKKLPSFQFTATQLENCVTYGDPTGATTVATLLGEANVVACLTANELLQPGLNDHITQADADACNDAARININNITRHMCLRRSGFLYSYYLFLTHFDLMECVNDTTYGVDGLEQCLRDKKWWLPPMVDQTVLALCHSAWAADNTKLMDRCLQERGYLSMNYALDIHFDDVARDDLIGKKCGSCHNSDSGNAAAIAKWNIPVASATKIATTLVNLAPYIDTDHPQISPLLTQPMKATGHGANTAPIWEKNSPEYYKILMWIRSGAK